MFYYVYEITNLINGHIYVGKRSSKDPATDKYMGSGKLIKAAIKKHGRDSFKKIILGIFLSDVDAAFLESTIVTKEFLKRDDVYNLHEGGFGGFAHLNDGSPEHIARTKRAGIKYGGGTKDWTEESFKKVRDTGKRNNSLGLTSGWKHTGEFRQMMSVKQSGDKNPNYGNVWCVEETAGNYENRKSFSSVNIPDGWITVKTFRDNKKHKNGTYGKKWFTDGSKNFLFNPANIMIEQLALRAGRTI